MNEIIKEELWRSVGIFCIALIIILSLSNKVTGIHPLILLLILPLSITLLIFLVLITVRLKKYKNRVYKRKPFSLKIYIIGGIAFLIIWFILQGKDAKGWIGLIGPLIIIAFLHCFLYLGRTKYPSWLKKTKLNTFGLIGILAIITGVLFLILILFIPTELIKKVIITSTACLISGAILLYANIKLTKR